MSLVQYTVLFVVVVQTESVLRQFHKVNVCFSPTGQYGQEKEKEGRQTRGVACNDATKR